MHGEDQRTRGEDGENVGHRLERVFVADLAARSRFRRRHRSRRSRDRGYDEQDERTERDGGTDQVAAEPARPEPLDVRG
jgi:hypothetical protein